MGLIARFGFAIKMTIAMAFAAIIHFRIGVEQIYPMAQTDFSGPFSGVADSLEFVVPIAILVIVLGSWAWVLYGPVQEERTVRTVRRP